MADLRRTTSRRIWPIRPRGKPGQCSSLANAKMLLPTTILLLSPTMPIPTCGMGHQDGADVRWFDLRALTIAGKSLGWRVDPRLHMTAAWIDALEVESADFEMADGGTFDQDVLVDVLLGAVEAVDEAEIEDTEVLSGRLRASGNAAGLNVIGEAIARLEDALFDDVSVQLYRLNGDDIDLGTGGTLDAAAASRLLDPLGAKLAAIESVRTGRLARLANGDLRTYVQDHDAEVAQFMGLTDPVISALRLGIEVGIRIDRAADGRRFIIRTWGRDGGQEGPFRSVELPALGGAAIELPRISTSQWFASGRIEPGGAIIVDHDGGGSEALAIRVLDRSGLPANALPLGLYGLEPVRPPFPDLSNVTTSQGTLWYVDREEEAQIPWEDRVVEPLAIALFDEALLSGSVRHTGSMMVPLTPTKYLDEPRRRLAELLEAVPLPSYSIEVRYGLVELGSGRAGAAEFATVAPQRMIGSALDGDAVLLVGGVEWAYLSDFDIQIAQAARVPDPKVASVFEGIAFWFAPVSKRGRAAGWCEVVHQSTDPEVRTVTTGMVRANAETEERPEDVFEIELPRSHRATTRTFLDVPAGAWTWVASRAVWDVFRPPLNTPVRPATVERAIEGARPRGGARRGSSAFVQRSPLGGVRCPGTRRVHLEPGARQRCVSAARIEPTEMLAEGVP